MMKNVIFPLAFKKNERRHIVGQVILQGRKDHVARKFDFSNILKGNRIFKSKQDCHFLGKPLILDDKSHGICIAKM
jgi:hypothetical protein